MSLTVRPSPWLHGCNRLITCLRLMKSLCWQLISGLWTQTYFTWPWTGTWRSLLKVFFPLFVGIILIFKMCFKEKPLFQDCPSHLPQGMFIAPFLLMFSVCLRFDLLVLCSGLFNLPVEKWIRSPTTLTRMDLCQKREMFVFCCYVIHIILKISYLTFFGMVTGNTEKSRGEY